MSESLYKKKYVYLIADTLNENIYKIGVTRGKIENRIKKLQTGNAGELYIFDYYETFYPFFIEKRLHLKYIDKKVDGEWFNLDVKEALKFKDSCKSIEDEIEVLKDNEFFMKNLK